MDVKGDAESVKQKWTLKGDAGSVRTRRNAKTAE